MFSVDISFIICYVRAMIKQDKHKLIKNILIALLIIALLMATYLWAAYCNTFWPFHDEFQSQNQVYESEKDALQSGSLQNLRQSTSTTDSSSSTGTSNDSYIEGKTPIQYEGQTDGSNTHGGYNNEQFRIPEDEL